MSQFIIPVSRITQDGICQILGRINYRAEIVGDEEIRVYLNDCVVFVHVVQERGVIGISCMFVFCDDLADATKSEKLTFLNTLNTELAFGRFYMDQGVVCYDYRLICDEGVMIHHLKTALDMFNYFVYSELLHYGSLELINLEG